MEDQTTKAEEYVRKFGTVNPTMDDVCRECGWAYGEHWSTDCPTTQLRRDTPKDEQC